MMFVMGALSFLTGIFSAVQSGSNATLAKALHQPILAAIIYSFVTGLTFLAFAPFLGLHMAKSQDIANVPWWAWIGGSLAATFVLSSIFFAEKLGSGIYIGLVVTAEIIASIVMDHYGLVGFKQHTASWPRILGAAIMIGGLGLVAAF